jgi:hypothetical protein
MRLHHGFLFHNDRCAGGRGIEESLGHSLRQANATVRRGVRWDITLVHRVAAPEKHRERHPRPIVMRARRSGVFARVDIRFHDIAGIVHVIAEHGRDVLHIFPENGVIAGRRAESRFASGNCRFSDELFAFEEIGALVGDADDNLRGTGNTVAVPVPLWRRRLGCAGTRRGLHFRATSHKGEEPERKSGSKQRLANHWMRRVIWNVRRSIPKICEIARPPF